MVGLIPLQPVSPPLFAGGHVYGLGNEFRLWLIKTMSQLLLSSRISHVSSVHVLGLTTSQKWVDNYVLIKMSKAVLLNRIKNQDNKMICYRGENMKHQ